MTEPADRVLGWDMLRGLCALAVALYHLLTWQDLGQLYTFGSYGVYLFFMLSGASLAYNYGGRLASIPDWAAFMVTRWLRLAPLYGVVCVVLVMMFSMRNGVWVDALPLRFALNLSFAFGLYDPTIWALGIGGWSLGIEFIYYLAFPLLLMVIARPALAVAAGLVLVLLQWWWIHITVAGPEGYAASAVAYHQVPAFAAYFFGGCLIGHWRRMRDLALPAWAGAAAWFGIALLLLALNPSEQGDELVGARGAALFFACFAVAWASAHARVPAALAPMARWLGDITYGCYLLHPVFFFCVAWFVLPRFGVADVEQAAPVLRWLLLVAVPGLSCVVASASERWFERPLRRWGKNAFQRGLRRARSAYSDAVSISS